MPEIALAHKWARWRMAQENDHGPGFLNNKRKASLFAGFT
jgi:hypothetical protein